MGRSPTRAQGPQGAELDAELAGKHTNCQLTPSWSLTLAAYKARGCQTYIAGYSFSYAQDPGISNNSHVDTRCIAHAGAVSELLLQHSSFASATVKHS